MNGAIDVNLVPHVRGLDAVYASGTSRETGERRVAALVAAFATKYGARPDYVARSSGRVNIIAPPGEHIDYCGFSVLPMAVDRDVLIAVRTRDASSDGVARVTLANINSEKYPDATFNHDTAEKGGVAIDASLHRWDNYFRCGYKGIHEDLALATLPPHMDVMVSGNVPAGAGLSSSSAFVCATAVAVAHANGVTPVKKDLTQTAIRSERYAGVQTGGMDQSISIMATPSSALLISFHPILDATPVPIPPHTRPYKFVVAHSLVTADKHVTAARNYNLRVLETRLAARLLGAWVSLGGGAGNTQERTPVRATTLREVLEVYMDTQRGSLGASAVTEARGAMVAGLKGLEGVAGAVLMEGAYNCDAIVEALRGKFGADTYTGGWADVEAEFCGGIGKVFLEDGLQLLKRTQHVLSEARRVLEFVEVCVGKVDSNDVLQSLGTLMNESQASCAQSFNCSCPELDELTALCVASGAVGSRLTGAGWGGCTVSLVPEELVEGFIAKVVDGYYKKHADNLSGVGDWIFSTTPGSGAAVIVEGF
ncbi:ribosomal protein S5 domain 2-type protein [Chytriomyces sp. MP71]|nr:ribosomal protein S5 domain 2-type protein [Chytriomyces sp. MP71]